MNVKGGEREKGERKNPQGSAYIGKGILFWVLFR